MPLILESGGTFKVVLESDKDKPEDKQPYFEFRYLSGRDWKKLADTADKIEQAKSGSAAIDVVFELLNMGLAGWGNMVDPGTGEEIAFDKDELERIVTIIEASELLQKFRNQGVEVEDLKNSESPSA